MYGYYFGQTSNYILVLTLLYLSVKEKKISVIVPVLM